MGPVENKEKDELIIILSTNRPNIPQLKDKDSYTQRHAHTHQPFA